LTKRKTDKSKMPVAPQEMDFADFANVSWQRQNPKEQTTSKSKVPEAHQEMDFADLAKQKKGGKSSRPKVAPKMDFTRKNEPTQESDTNDTVLYPVREKSSRRSSLSRQMQKPPTRRSIELLQSPKSDTNDTVLYPAREKSSRRSSLSRQMQKSPSRRSRELLQSPSPSKRTLMQKSQKSPSRRSRELLQSPSKRRLSQSRGEVMSPSACRSSQSRDAQGKRILLRAKHPDSPEMETAAVATSEHVNKESIGEIAKLLKRSKVVHAENQHLEEEKRDSRLSKIRARRRARKAPVSPDHTVATHWERNPSMGLQPIPTM
jgi:hypothetical protein